MPDKQTAIRDIDVYIAQQAPGTRKILAKLRAVIRKAAPDAMEKISYNMPTYYLNGNLVHFAAYKHHIGFYPTPSAITAFAKDIAGYKWAKGSVQFPLDEQIPYELVTRMVKYRVSENLKK